MVSIDNIETLEDSLSLRLSNRSMRSSLKKRISMLAKIIPTTRIEPNLVRIRLDFVRTSIKLTKLYGIQFMEKRSNF